MPGQQRRGRRAVVDRGDVAPPGAWRGRSPAASSRQAKMRSPWPLGPRPVCRSIQASSPAARAVLAQHLAQRLVAPGRARAAVEEAVADGGTGRRRWPAAAPSSPCVATIARRCRRASPHRGGQVAGHDQRRRARRRRRCAARRREVAEVAVQVDVLVRRPPPPREAPGVEAVDVEHGDAGRAAPRSCQAASPSSATCTPEPQKPSTPWQALLTTSSAWRVRAGRRGRRPSPASRRRGRAADARAVSTPRPRERGRGEELVARLGVALREMGAMPSPARRARGLGRRVARRRSLTGARSQASASRTQSVRAERDQLVVEVVARVVQHAGAHAVAALAVRCRRRCR